MLAYFKGSAAADISYEYIVNYEFVPIKDYDRYGVREGRVGEPSSAMQLL